MKNIQLSLSDLLGESYVKAVCHAKSMLTGDAYNELVCKGEEKVSFYPDAFQERQNKLMDNLGETVCDGYHNSMVGAPTQSYAAAQHSAAAPLGGIGCYRIGEDGRLYFAGKSEHYHIPLGHNFPGYNLIDNAKKLGILNATHNNTRGYITRLLERSLIAAANGLAITSKELDMVLAKKETGVLNTVINLETGSLAVEAALKMMLSRFYSLDGAKTLYEGRTPVFLVMADNAGGITAGYHGTTIVAQTLRGLWPELLQKVEQSGIYKVVSVPINNSDAFSKAIAEYNKPPYKTAGFCHEIIMMNYGGIRLDEKFLHFAYDECRKSDTPVLCDEIQSCAWYDGLFLFRKYGLNPDFVSIGKGFPGGNYPASKILTSAAFDSLNQFGALVTNGQEELASLSYLITMAFIKANGAEITALGESYHNKMAALAEKYPDVCAGVEGDAHMTAIAFKNVDAAVSFCSEMNTKYCVDISAQAYKPNCPPVALTKLPLITSEIMIDGLISKFEQALCTIAHKEN
ncbi:MAG: aminotransferase class III-fold pyridoxal phosphate-dependent enzyme [Christensenella sp.]